MTLKIHLDVGPTPDAMNVHLVRELTDKYQRGGRVAVGHMAKLSLLPPDQVAALARRLADSGVAVTVLPTTDLFLMGRVEGLRLPAADVGQELRPDVFPRTQEDAVGVSSRLGRERGDVQAPQRHEGAPGAIVVGQVIGPARRGDVDLDDDEIRLVVEIETLDVLVL